MSKKWLRYGIVTGILLTALVGISFSFNILQASSEEPIPLVLTEMPVVNDATCWGCHPNFAPVTSGPYSTTPIIGGLHPVDKCLRCHTTSLKGIQQMRNCTACHYPKGSLPNYPLLMSLRHTTDGAVAFENLPTMRHEIPTEHTSSTVGCSECHGTTFTNEHNIAGRTDSYKGAINCNTCHRGSGLGERKATNGALKILKTQNYQVQWTLPWTAPAGETISRLHITHALDNENYIEIYALYNGKWGMVYGQTSGVVDTWIDLPYVTTKVKYRLIAPYPAVSPVMWGADIPDVEYTPKATNAFWNKVTSAIDNDKRGCFDCHDSALEHESLHATNFSQNCQGACHSGSLTQEHKKYNVTCVNCHEPAVPVAKYQQAILWSQKDCTACHGTGHNMNFAYPVPSDVLKYDGYLWSNANDIALWAGESWVPAEAMDGGKMIFSNRRAVNKDTVANWYQENYALKGWTLSGSESGESTFKYTFAKDKMRIWVLFDNGKLSIVYKVLP